MQKEWHQILYEWRKDGVTDLHLTKAGPILGRIQGKIRPLSGEASALFSFFMEKIKPDFQEEQETFDQTITLKESRFRLHLYQSQGEKVMAIRFLAERIPEVTEIGLPEKACQRFLKQRAGLILVCGETGSGKSTTMAALIQAFLREEARHVVTFEEPIEYLFKEKQGLVHQCEIGKDISSLEKGLVEVLRADPDIIMIGELRERDTYQLALSAAESGHLVFGSLHANSATEALERITATFPEGERGLIQAQLAHTLVGIIQQVLVPHKEEKQRLGVFEILLNTPAISALIREGKFHLLPSKIQTGGQEGMISQAKALAKLFQEEKITRHMAEKYAFNKKELKFYMK